MLLPVDWFYPLSIESSQFLMQVSVQIDIFTLRDNLNRLEVWRMLESSCASESCLNVV